jgi:ERF superfamily
MSDVIQVPAPTSILSIIAQAATDPRVDVVKMQALLDMQERVLDRQAEEAFNAALHAAQQEMPRVAKNGTIKMGDKGDIPFATLEDVDAALRPIMQRNGFSISYDMAHKDGGGAVISGTLRHTGGHAKTATIPLALDSGPGRNNLQAMGSTFSYGRRYLLEMFFNVIRTGADDDGKRGGSRFITDDQAETIRDLMRQAGRQEGPFLDRLFSGAVRSVEEIEAGAYVVVKNTLDGILAQRAKKEAG